MNPLKHNNNKLKNFPEFNGPILKGKEVLEGLYLVATPIGNLEDITLRAIRILKEADYIACEDTRVSLKLLQHYGIKKPLLSYHDFSDVRDVNKIKAFLEKGGSVALISDAGTPLISDPGFKLVRACLKSKLKITPIPGPCAAISGLISSGIPSNHFHFEGFLPAKKKQKSDRIKALAAMETTLVFYESGNRLLASLELFSAILGGSTLASVAREMTKSYEEFKTASLNDLMIFYKAAPAKPKGEIVLIIEARPIAEAISKEKLRAIIQTQLMKIPLKEIAKNLAFQTGYSKNEIYALALEMKAKTENA